LPNIVLILLGVTEEYFTNILDKMFQGSEDDENGKCLREAIFFTWLINSKNFDLPCICVY